MKYLDIRWALTGLTSIFLCCAWLEPGTMATAASDPLPELHSNFLFGVGGVPLEGRNSALAALDNDLAYQPMSPDVIRHAGSSISSLFVPKCWRDFF